MSQIKEYRALLGNLITLVKGNEEFAGKTDQQIIDWLLDIERPVKEILSYPVEVTTLIVTPSSYGVAIGEGAPVDKVVDKNGKVSFKFHVPVTLDHRFVSGEDVDINTMTTKNTLNWSIRRRHKYDDQFVQGETFHFFYEIDALTGQLLNERDSVDTPETEESTPETEESTPETKESTPEKALTKRERKLISQHELTVQTGAPIAKGGCWCNNQHDCKAVRNSLTSLPNPYK